MKKLIIHNIGPIKHISINLKRINVIMGPQSSGKSCLLKIACFCAWVEKRMELEQGRNGFSNPKYIENQLIKFHKLDGYVTRGNGAYFSYSTENVAFSYHFDDENPFWYKWNGKHWQYKRSRISYIPAERNIIASVPNLLEINMDRNNIRNFINDWNLARTLFDNQKLSLLSMGIQYQYDRQTGRDVVILNDGKSLDFANASSGLQSVIPMCVYLDFLFHKQYNDKSISRISADSENEQVLLHIYNKKFKPNVNNLQSYNVEEQYIGEIGDTKLKFANYSQYEECKKMFESFTETHFSDIYLEEPEQNLFPLTQVELIKEILKNAAEHNDCISIATHSPYILYALNNCMLGYLAKENIREENLDELLQGSECWVNPKDVCVWEIKDGELKTSDEYKNGTIQDATGLIRKNYFDSIMRDIMSEFTNLLPFYE